MTRITADWTSGNELYAHKAKALKMFDPSPNLNYPRAIGPATHFMRIKLGRMANARHLLSINTGKIVSPM
jgi:hypothetical protein